jgi:ribosomal protein S12 methylthiotransferase
VHNVSLVSLGCPKNLVDSESLLKKLAEQGIGYEHDPGNADVLLINTCGFIEDAKRESIEEILKLVETKGQRRLIVFGCLAKRFGDELKKEIPEIDAVYGVGEEDKIVEYCKDVAGIRDSKAGAGVGKKISSSTAPQSLMPGPDSYAYLKIAEGCDRGCTYCVIPDIRGSFRSRAPEDILKEAERLVMSGRKELIVIAQDITSYGRDIPGYGLSRLVKDLASISGDFWVRLLYLYPTSINDELIETVRVEEKVCKYFDIPLQHTEPKILGLMKRGGNREYFRNMIARIREAIPEVALRTTLITGFPQETDEDFEHMLGFVQEMHFEHLGVFAYSREEGSLAYSLKGQVPKHIKKKRRDRIMQAQATISLENNKKLVGKTFRALVDDIEGEAGIARVYSQSPEIDGVVFVDGPGVRKGTFIQVRISKAYDYDLQGMAVL